MGIRNIPCRLLVGLSEKVSALGRDFLYRPSGSQTYDVVSVISSSTYLIGRDTVLSHLSFDDIDRKCLLVPASECKVIPSDGRKSCHLIWDTLKV